MGRQRSTIGLRYAKQVDPAVIPTTGWKNMRFTGESLKTDTAVIRSNEILSNRQSQGPVRGGVTGGGGINFEWSYEAFDDWLEFALGGTWTSDQIGVAATVPYVCVEKSWGQLATPKFDLYSIGVCSGLTLDASVGGIVTGAASIVSKGGVIGTTKASSGAVAAASNNPIFNSSDYIQVITEGGSPLTGVTKLSFAIANTASTQGELGTPDVTDALVDTFVLSGSLTTYLSDSSLIAKYRSFTDTTLAFTLGGATNKKYAFDIPGVNYTGSQELAGGKGQPVLVELTWEAKYDQGSDNTVLITRTD